jgi:energy-coupling factor transporter transmembrane protein EcfT
MLRIGHVEVGCGGLVDVVRLTALSLVILATSALVTWTTDIADVAPATASWGRWPRAGRCPIEDWSVKVVSPLRILPMLIDELQVVEAVRRLRAKPTPRIRVHQLRLAAAGVGDRVTAMMPVSSRRADELGTAINARGGAGQITELSQPRRADLITLLSVIAVCITAVAVQPMVHG